ncbi:chorismate mutase [Tropicimonas sp. IMCC34043]|uniref:chorismate mutase n=1 Tax=Tropicimonas sp. IMCC34043 TaxID=2248760 RepID=UPI000E23CF17|nr:chorismate mutase [Tropicimonas sp. IMCC34043]
MTRRPPESCETMAELRAQIDALDEVLVTLLAERARHIDRAAQIKAGAGLPARIEARVEEVVAHVRGKAAETGLDADLAEGLWRAMIEWSIAREARLLGEAVEGGGTGAAG